MSRRLVATKDSLDLAQQTARRVLGTVFTRVGRGRGSRSRVSVHIGNTRRSVLSSGQRGPSIIVDVRAALGSSRRVIKVARRSVSGNARVLCVRSRADSSADGGVFPRRVKLVGVCCASEVGSLDALVAGTSGGSVEARGSVFTNVRARVAESVRVFSGGRVTQTVRTRAEARGRGVGCVVGGGGVGAVFASGSRPDTSSGSEAGVLLASDRVRGEVVARTVGCGTGLLKAKKVRTCWNTTDNWT